MVDGVRTADRASSTAAPRPWRLAMAEALYGANGFYARGQAPGEHFRTSVSAGPAFAEGILALLRRVDLALGRPDPLDLVDVGAGRGELLHAVATVTTTAEPELSGRLRLSAVEVAPRPRGPAADRRQAATVRWATSVPPQVTGLLVANEWLDDIPLDIVEQTVAGPRLVMVTPAGAESLGAAPAPADAAWLARWWPLRPGERGEVGRSRDEAWAGAVGSVRRGVAVAIDYAHRLGGRPAGGTLSGYRAGRAGPAVPNGSCNITAHVALDACAAAGRAAGATVTLLTTQRHALRELGVTGRRPPTELARTDPGCYLKALARAGEAGELTDPGGLGGFDWLVQGIGVPLPLR